MREDFCISFHNSKLVIRTEHIIIIIVIVIVFLLFFRLRVFYYYFAHCPPDRPPVPGNRSPLPDPLKGPDSYSEILPGRRYQLNEDCGLRFGSVCWAFLRTEGTLPLRPPSRGLVLLVWGGGFLPPLSQTGGTPVEGEGPVLWGCL